MNEQVEKSLQRMALTAQTAEYKARKAAWEKVKSDIVAKVRLENSRIQLSKEIEKLVGENVYSWDTTLGAMVDTSLLTVAKQTNEIKSNLQIINQLLQEVARHKAQVQTLTQIIEPIYHRANNSYNKWTMNRDKKKTLNYPDALLKLKEFWKKLHKE